MKLNKKQFKNYTVNLTKKILIEDSINLYSNKYNSKFDKKVAKQFEKYKKYLDINAKKQLLKLNNSWNEVSCSLSLRESPMLFFHLMQYPHYGINYQLNIGIRMVNDPNSFTIQIEGHNDMGANQFIGHKSEVKFTFQSEAFLLKFILNFVKQTISKYKENNDNRARGEAASWAAGESDRGSVFHESKNILLENKNKRYVLYMKKGLSATMEIIYSDDTLQIVSNFLEKNSYKYKSKNYTNFIILDELEQKFIEEGKL